MSTAALNLPYTPHIDSGAIRSFVFAVIVHCALFSLLYFGVRWQSETPSPIEAELWTAVPSTPAPAPKIEAPRVEAKPEPKPEVVEPPKPVPKPDIEIKSEKKPEPKKAEPKKEEPKAFDPIRDALLKEEMQRKASQETVAQAAAKDVAAAAGRENQNWLRAINAHIKRSFVFADISVNPNIEARFEITLSQSLAILNVRLIKPSGNAAFDAAAQRAIDASSPLPAPMSAAVAIPRTIEVPMRPEKK